jgi:hypothetical protein
MTADGKRDVDERVAALADLDRTALLGLWVSAFGPDVPPRLSRALMEKAIAYEIQAKAFGGLPVRTKRAIKAAVKADGKVASPPIPGRGTRFIREWHGRLHEVEVLDDSYLYRGEGYRSLSAIAQAITGTKWSGPRFFALREGS